MREFLKTLQKAQGSRRQRRVWDVAGQKAVAAVTRPSPGAQLVAWQDMALLAQHYGVSYQAAVYRVRSLNLISRPGCEALLKQEPLARRYLKMVLNDPEEVDDPARADRDLRRQILYLAIEAHRREEISGGRLGDIGRLLSFDPAMVAGLVEG